MAIPLLTKTVVAVGDLYDTGREYLENHRFRKRECHDARNVRTPAIAISTLRDQNPIHLAGSEPGRCAYEEGNGA